MKKLPVYSLALLLVPWSACNNQTDTKQPAIGASNAAAMILPPAIDTVLPSGRKNVYLSGRRNQNGFFVERSTFPPGYKGMPHLHNADIYVTILNGSVHLVLDEKFDTTVQATPYGPGSFIIIPADQPHYEWFTEECTMQISGIGPNETFYVSGSDE